MKSEEQSSDYKHNCLTKIYTLINGNKSAFIMPECSISPVVQQRLCESGLNGAQFLFRPAEGGVQAQWGEQRRR